jgi:DNA (cytosine-5)-methyltransferase 1
VTRTAEHRPATRRRRFAHDDLIAVDLFSGFGGLTRGIEKAGFTTIMAANHNRYKVEIHEANHPHAEHWIADLVDPDSSDYHSARDLPAADLLVAGISCVNHSAANTVKAYHQGLTLFDLEDPEFEERVTRSERDRATANCVLHYAERHHPRLILIECTTQLASWGPAIPGRPKVGDGSTYRWWLKQFAKLNYRHKVLYLNSMFFGVPQSRDRLYIAFWDKRLPAPDLEHRPLSWCGRCERVVGGVWTWRTGIPPTGLVCYGKQYDYRCPACRAEVVPAKTPALAALDLTNLGTRIGDKPIRTFKDGSRGPLAASTMARAERCRQRFAEFPAVLMPVKALRGSERHPWQPMVTQTSQQETAILSTGAVIAAHRHNGDGKHVSQPMDTMTTTHERAVLLAVDNYQGAPRSAGDPLPTQVGSETLGLLTARVLPNRTNGTSRGLGEPMPTVTADQVPGLLTAAGRIENDGTVAEATRCGARRVAELVTTGASTGTQEVLFSGSAKTGTVAALRTDPFGTHAVRLDPLLAAEWRATLAQLTLEDCYFRMMFSREVGRGCGFDVSFPGHQGDFIVWGSDRDQVDGFGNAVSPAVGEWIGSRLRAILDTPEAAA